MAQKIIKLRCSQAGPFQANSIVDLEIPSSLGFIDMDKSYIVLEQLALTGSVVGVNPYLPYGGMGLIRNCRLESDRVGKLEEIQQVNVIGANLANVAIDQEMQKQYSIIYNYGNQPNPKSGQNISNFATLAYGANGVINAVPALAPADTLVPLSWIFGYQGQLPVNVLGNCRVRLEFDNNNNYYAFGDAAADATPALVVGNAAVANNNTTFTFTTAYTNSQTCPFGVNEEVTLYDNANRTNPVNATITTIEANNATSTVTAMVFNGVNKANATHVERKKDMGITWSCSGISMVVYQDVMNNEQMNSYRNSVNSGVVIPYKTWSADLENSSNASFYNHLYDIEPNCLNAIAITPALIQTGGAATTKFDLISKRDGATSYRYLLNNVDLCNREIQPLDSLYKDRLMQTFANTGLPMRNLGKLNQANANSQILYCTPIWQSPQPQILQFSLNGAGMVPKTMLLYKQVEKALEIKGNNVMVI